MNFLLDTNAISEPQRARPDPVYMDWLSVQDPDTLFVSVLAFGEIRVGVMALPAGPHRAALEAWVNSVSALFPARLLAIDEPVIRAWAQVALGHKQADKRVGLADELIAATAITHDLTLVTNNRRDFEASGCKLLRPWSGR